MDPETYYEHLTRLYCRLVGHEWHLGYWLNANTLSEAVANLTALMARRLTLTEHMTVLDLGCGVGGGACYLAETAGCRVIGASTSRPGLAEAERWARQQELAHLVSFRYGDARDLPFPKHSFDAVWSCEAIHNIDDLGSVAKEIGRVLKPRGAAVLGDLFLLEETADPESPALGLDSYGFHLRTADQWVSALQQHGLDVEESISIGHHTGVQSLGACAELFRAEAPNHADDSLQRTLCERTVEATSRLLTCFERREVSWGIWSARAT